MMQFPDGFLWGATLSSYQAEGDNISSDWQGAGAAARHYELYRQDFDLAKQLNHNAHRLSIEWSRIEPEAGKFSEQEINHYIEVIDSLRAGSIEPVVTLHHFTNPLWFSHTGGWLNPKAPEYFSRYAQKIVDALAGKVKFWITINEPLVYVYHSYILGVWPPHKKSFFKAKKVTKNLLCAHTKAYKLIHSIYKSLGLESCMVSIAKNLQSFVPCNLSFKNRLAVYLRNKLYNFDPLEKLIRQRSLDFIGVNYYTRNLIDVTGWSLTSLLIETCKNNHSSLKKNSLGWDIYPQGLYELLMRLNKYRLPIFITENGICTDDDSLRKEFIHQHLKQVYLAIQQGVKVLGYLYWSLLDNYEWDKGFGPRFGIIEVDYTTYKRRVRESAKFFAEVIKSGSLKE
ncbi:MAG: glycoside hydrolase family 1 protein [Candidatus Omnitrophica bacterium]|nr:glycoside hydrolase family 1 protein [Candidatus Omnitrophota bacterium]